PRMNTTRSVTIGNSMTWKTVSCLIVIRRIAFWRTRTWYTRQRGRGPFAPTVSVCWLAKAPAIRGACQDGRLAAIWQDSDIQCRRDSKRTLKRKECELYQNDRICSSLRMG